MAKFNEAALTKLISARIKLLSTQPFFGTLAMRLTLVEDPSVSTLCVDGKEVRYNSDFILGLSKSLTVSALAHEVMHCVLGHCGPAGRGMSFNPWKWNCAVDYVVNAILRDAGFELGAGWLYDPAYAGMTSEKIYHMLPDDDGKKPLDEVKSGSGTPAEQSMQQVEWKVAATQAATAAHAAGKLHKSMQTFVEEMNTPKVNWVERLRQFVSSSSKNDYSYRRMNRKMQAVGHYLPGLHSEEIGQIVIASDESGSVDRRVMAAFGAEISAIQADLRPEKITLMHFAVDMGHAEEFGPDDAFRMKRFCNGGTDFRPVMEAAQALTEQPVCMIYLTDLEGPFPAHPPGFPVLWVTINRHVAPFGDTIQIEV